MSLPPLFFSEHVLVGLTFVSLLRLIVDRPPKQPFFALAEIASWISNYRVPSADLFGEALTTPTYALEGALDLQMTSRGSDLPLLTISLYYFG